MIGVNSMKSVYDLNEDELDELRESLFDQPDSEEIFGSVDNITDEILFEHYEDVYFVDDDFWCNQKEAD